MVNKSTADGEHTVRTLWHGSPLSVFERLSLLSFVKHGHRTEVYAYEPLDVPDGVHLCDASEIHPASEAFSYSGGPAQGSFAAFSNLFRIKLLSKKGGIWADSDLLCLRPLHDLPSACVGRHQEDFMNGAFLKFPPGHSVCLEILEKAEALGSSIKLGQMSGLITESVTFTSTSCEVLPVPAIYPVAWKDTWLLVDPEQRAHCDLLAESSHCVHWWNTAITLVMGMPKEALPPVGSFLYEHARTVLSAADLRAWPIELARPWIRSFKAFRPEDAPDPSDEIRQLRAQVDSLRAELAGVRASRRRTISEKLRSVLGRLGERKRSFP